MFISYAKTIHVFLKGAYKRIIFTFTYQFKNHVTATLFQFPKNATNKYMIKWTTYVSLLKRLLGASFEKNWHMWNARGKRPKKKEKLKGKILGGEYFEKNWHVKCQRKNLSPPTRSKTLLLHQNWVVEITLMHNPQCHCLNLLRRTLVVYESKINAE